MATSTKVKHRIISSDDHIFEPPGLWTDRITSGEFKDRIPHVKRTEDGSDWWFCDGNKLSSAFSATQAGVRFQDPDSLTIKGADTNYDNVIVGSYDPVEHLKDMDIDGVDVGIIYPTIGLFLYGIPDGRLLDTVFSTYNDWLADFCATDPNRLKGIAMINVDDVQVGIKELERCAKMDCYPGAMISVYPQEANSYDNPMYEPLWAAANELEIPLSLHVGTNRPGPGQEFQDLETVRPAFTANTDHWARVSVAHMIFSGVFERYPKLQVGIVEVELSWAPHFLDRMDYAYKERPREWAPYRFKDDMIPSDFFHRNIFMSFQEDAVGIRLRDIIGVDNLVWGADYPHPEGTWPRSREILAEILADCTEEEKEKIVGKNAAKLYKL